MPTDRIEIIDEGRFVEVDTVLKRLNMKFSMMVSGAAALFVGRFGLEFLVCASLPLLWWIGRRVLRLQHRIGLRRWNIVLMLLLLTSTASGAALTGGVRSPAIYFAGIAAMLMQATFPEWLLSRFSGVGVVAIVGVTDVLRGHPVGMFELLTATVIAGYLPRSTRQLVEVEQVQRRSAAIDTLTGCLNRRSFGQRSAEIDAECRRTGAAVAVISLDVDHFKAVNDRWGHATGDHVLQRLAYTAREQLRQFEPMFRVGGEEFVVLLSDTDAADAVEVAERIRHSIETMSVDGISVTSSFGVAVGAEGVEVVLAKADERLYAAKASGRNRVIGPDRAPVSEHSGTSDSPGAISIARTV